MGFTARLVGEEERESYNRFVAWGPKGHIFQSYEWGELKKRTGWRPFRLMVEENGRPVGAISVLKRSLPGFRRKSIFYAPRAPVIDLGRSDAFLFLISKVRELARQEGGIFIKIDPDIPYRDAAARETIERAGFRPSGKSFGFEGVQPRFVFRLDIRPSLEELLSRFHSKTRYNIRLAQKRGVTVKEAATKSDLVTFYRLLAETAERDKFVIRSYSYFDAFWDELIEKGLAAIFLAYYEGEPIAGSLALVFGDKAWYLYGASSNRHRNVMPNHLLQWEMIRWAKGKGCSLYDLRGVPGDLSPENPLYGLYRFKKGFAGEYVEFMGEYDLVFDPLFYFLWRQVEPVYSSLVRLPFRLRALGR